MNIKLYVITPALWFINTYIKCCSRLTRIKESLHTAINTLTSDDIYMFLNNSVFPHDFKQYTKISIKCALMYNMSKNLFYPYNYYIVDNDICNIGLRSPIPILSLQIIDKHGEMMHDLTDFIESMRYIKLSPIHQSPSIGHIISVWQISSRIILDESEVSAEYINRSGDSIKTTIRNLTDLYIE